MMRESSLASPPSLLLFAGVALLPVYYFASGGVQPAHILLALFSVLVLVQRGFRSENWSLLLLALTSYVFVIELTYGIRHGGEVRGILNAVFFFYNFMLTAAVAIHIERVGLKPVYFGVLVAASLGTISVIVYGVDLHDISETGRATGAFNNPNQLGFFSTCLLSSAYFLFAAKRISYSFLIILIALALFLSVVSLSKAAIVANGLVLFMALKPRFNKKSILFWLLGSFVAVMTLLQLYNTGILDDYLFVQRLQVMSVEQDSSLAARGYFVVLDAPWYQVLFGMGSYNIKLAIGHEVHSTLGNALNNYGIVGLSLMIAILTNWTIKIYRHFGFAGVISIVGPSMLYGITHNGSRFVFFWVLFATTIGFIHRLNKASVPPLCKTIFPHP